MSSEQHEEKISNIVCIYKVVLHLNHIGRAVDSSLKHEFKLVLLEFAWGNFHSGIRQCKNHVRNFLF